MSNRRDRKEELRRERLAREQAARESARRKRLAGIGAGVLLAVAALVIGGIALLGGGDDGGGGGGGGPDNAASISYPDEPPTIPQPKEFDLRKAAEAAGCELVNPEPEGSDHTTEPVTYRSNPPTSGAHHPQPADDQAYEEAPGANHLVHSLEHGRIVIQFRPNAPQATIDRLKALYDEDPYHVILTPNTTNMPFEVAATAWERALTCERMSDGAFDAIRSFKDRYRDKGPEFVP